MYRKVRSKADKIPQYTRAPNNGRICYNRKCIFNVFWIKLAYLLSVFTTCISTALMHRIHICLYFNDISPPQQVGLRSISSKWNVPIGFWNFDIILLMMLHENSFNCLIGSTENSWLQLSFSMKEDGNQYFYLWRIKNI